MTHGLATMERNETMTYNPGYVFRNRWSNFIRVYMNWVMKRKHKETTRTQEAQHGAKET